MGVTDRVANVDKATGLFGPPDQIFVRATAFGFSDVDDNGTARLNGPFSFKFVRPHREEQQQTANSR
jgi:hypothetical protein